MSRAGQPMRADSSAVRAEPGELWLPAPAKINLFLHVLGRRPDGYHRLQTLYQFLHFADQLHFKPTANPGIRRIDLHPYALPDEDLIMRAATRLNGLRRPAEQAAGGVDIRLQKAIPPGTGIGGGSSNAATTLIGLNRLWNLQLERNQLMQIGLELGADVPVFLFGHAAWGDGIGERLQPCAPDESWYCLLLPPVAVSTAAIFACPTLCRSHTPVSWQDYLRGTCGNDLQAVTCAHYPQVAAGLKLLSAFGPARMSGSGSGLFLRCADQPAARRIAAQIPPAYRPMAVKSGNRHPLAEPIDTPPRHSHR